MVLHSETHSRLTPLIVAIKETGTLPVSTADRGWRRSVRTVNVEVRILRRVEVNLHVSVGWIQAVVHVAVLREHLQRAQALNLLDLRSRHQNFHWFLHECGEDTSFAQDLHGSVCSHLLTLVPRSRIFYPEDGGDTYLRNVISITGTFRLWDVCVVCMQRRLLFFLRIALLDTTSFGLIGHVRGCRYISNDVNPHSTGQSKHQRQFSTFGLGIVGDLRRPVWFVSYTFFVSTFAKFIGYFPAELWFNSEAFPDSCLHRILSFCWTIVLTLQFCEHISWTFCIRYRLI
jgi:hypothetical protein